MLVTVVVLLLLLQLMLQALPLTPPLVVWGCSLPHRPIAARALGDPAVQPLPKHLRHLQMQFRRRRQQPLQLCKLRPSIR